MDDGERNKPVKVALLGSYPPPYGGVSVHIKRLKCKLKEKGIDCVVYDFSEGQKDVPDDNVVVRNPLKWLVNYLFTAKESIIHVHTSSWQLRAAIVLLELRGKKTVISIHGESLRDSLRKGNRIKKRLVKFTLKRASFIIAANQDIERLVLSLGISKQKVTVAAPFIPQVVKEEDYEKVPQYVWSFIHEHKPVISANAFSIIFRDGIDLYGLDLIVELTTRLKRKYQKVGIVICLPHAENKKYFDKLEQEIKERGLSEHILFITRHLDVVYPIWQESDIFVRPTVVDGDALSVREAMYFKTPVVTSDACPRPEGVTLFKNRDIDSFTDNVEMVLDNYDQFKCKAESIEVESGINKILWVYNYLVNGREQ